MIYGIELYINHNFDAIKEVQMNLKKIFAVSIAVLLTVFILFGCTALQQASDTTEDVTTSLHFVDYTRQGDGNGADDGYYRLVLTIYVL